MVSRWNEVITSSLERGARKALLDAGASSESIVTLEVPGAFELPLACKWAAQSGKYDAVIALGVVIRGDTPHFDYVAGEAAAGIRHVALKTGIPVMFGVLTVNELSQAEERAADGPDNKGYEAALSAVEMAVLKSSLIEPF